MKILVYGAGVLGSLYAARLSQSGNDVTILARGSRYDEILQNGIVLVNAMSRLREQIKVPVVKTLEPEDAYDLVIVLVRQDQVSQLLPALAVNCGSKIILFMVNNPLGYSEWAALVGRERILIGFAGAGGTRVNGEITYNIVSGLLQPTTFGEIDRSTSQRLRNIKRLFSDAGFPTAISGNMNAWQKTHVAWVSPVANAIYMAGGDGKLLANRPDVIKTLIQAIKEGFGVLKALNVPITPSKFNLLNALPDSWLAFALKKWAVTRHFEIIATRHTLAAFDEMIMISSSFQTLARQADTSTPALDLLHQGLQTWKASHQ